MHFERSSEVVPLSMMAPIPAVASAVSLYLVGAQDWGRARGQGRGQG